MDGKNILFSHPFKSYVLSGNWYRGRVARLSSAKAATAVRICSVPQLDPAYGQDFLFMLTTDEKDFIRYWALNRSRKKKSLWQYSIGLPMGVLVILALFANIISGWHKRAQMELQSSSSSMILTIVIAAISIVIFITVFSIRHKWDQHEQRYQELLLKQENEGAAL